MWLSLEVRLAGLPVQIPVARRFVADALGDGHPCRADAMLLASEVGTNAINHSLSGEVGGSFLLTVHWTEGWARVAVADQGAAEAPCLRRAGLGEASGRGIALLDELAVRWGFMRRSVRGTEVWFVLGEPPRRAGVHGAAGVQDSEPVSLIRVARASEAATGSRSPKVPFSGPSRPT
ncbi:ATP-binding protein [Spirillospora sp. NBC_01491]|uniref:ATP-binding protein n=1 Tax=Spirillospora sp. NBC_01491 TaxID=2976007 RepID=UPI002E370082|nr:ATP-binding protein [Spirillospora sp. NBC_01491]